MHGKTESKGSDQFSPPGKDRTRPNWGKERNKKKSSAPTHARRPTTTASRPQRQKAEPSVTAREKKEKTSIRPSVTKMGETSQKGIRNQTSTGWRSNVKEEWNSSVSQ